VPTFTCGFVRANVSLAMEVSGFELVTDGCLSNY
jgi:hypothetical protein